MTLLTDSEICLAWAREYIGIEPFDEHLLQPASIDVRLHHQLLLPAFGVQELDLENVPEGHMQPVEMRSGEVSWLEPGQFLLGCTREVVQCGPGHAARFEGKSSLARAGLLVHITGGFIDPGFHGQITVEIKNVAPWRISLRPDMRIGQIAFHRLGKVPDRLYGDRGNHYQGQMGPTATAGVGRTPVQA